MEMNCSIAVSYNAIINEMPLFGVGMSPSCPKFVFLMKENNSDDEIMSSTIAEKHNSTSVDVSDQRVGTRLPSFPIVPLRRC